MKKTMLAMMVLAGISLLVGIVLKIAGMTHGIMGTVPSSYLEMTKILLLAAIALRCCCKCHHKHDGEKKEGDSCCK